MVMLGLALCLIMMPRVGVAIVEVEGYAVLYPHKIAAIRNISKLGISSSSPLSVPLAAAPASQLPNALPAKVVTTCTTKTIYVT